MACGEFAVDGTLLLISRRCASPNPKGKLLRAFPELNENWRKRRRLLRTGPYPTVDGCATPLEAWECQSVFWPGSAVPLVGVPIPSVFCLQRVLSVSRHAPLWAV